MSDSGFRGDDLVPGVRMFTDCRAPRDKAYLVPSGMVASLADSTAPHMCTPDEPCDAWRRADDMDGAPPGERAPWVAERLAGVAAEAMSDMLVMLGVDPGETPDDHSAPTTAVVLGRAAVEAALAAATADDLEALAHQAVAEIRARALRVNDALVERVAARVHEGWMAAKRAQGVESRPSEWGEEQMVPYEQLSERAKELDRATTRAVLIALADAEGGPR